MDNHTKTVAAEKHPEIAEAEEILHAQTVEYKTAKALVLRLKKKKLFGYARKILSLARQTNIGIDEKPGLWLAQQHALCTYKDADLPADDRLDRALKILESYLHTRGTSLASTKDQETLGIAGAIHKRKWEVDSQKQHLECSLAYYLRGYAEGPAQDYGYTGINAAFLLDLLAHQETREAAQAGSISAIAAARRTQAEQIRRTLIDVLPSLPEQATNTWLQKEWWFYVAVAEAFFGCHSYEEARLWLRKANALEGVADWERESTAWQLTCLAEMHDQDTKILGDKNDGKASLGAAWGVLSEILQDNIDAVKRSFDGKIGLALSGGGFRASLFHIGVLAELAERDVLRRVEVLSCVSGGSIIGAHYYLEVRKLLKEKLDRDITRDDYIEIVKRIEEDFLDGVQTNIRTRVAAEFTTNLKLIFSKHYSRTQRAGELYETKIFSRVQDGEGDKPRWLNELKIAPKNEPEDFSPKLHNWRRHAKVPILILNATALNTGHNWQFTASWMGEAPAGIDSKIDGNDRLRRLYYQDAPETPVNHRQVRLGHAVGASACVPGLFEPLVLADLYPDMTARLVDGGVHDNQGISGLLEQDCTVLLVSDGSGQMDTKKDPSAGPLGVPLRANNILMARVRVAQYHEVDARRRSSLLRGLMYVHLKDEIEGTRLDWRECKEAPDPDEVIAKNDSMTSYSIPKETQKLLAAVRTDLDSFSDAEAYALMLSGYRQTEKEFRGELLKELGGDGDYEPANWRFLAIEKELRGTPVEGRDLKKLLEAASSSAFKIWKLNPHLQILARVLAVAAFGGLVWACWMWWSKSLLSVGMVASAVATAVAAVLLGPTIMRMVQYRKTLTEVGIGCGLGFAGFLLARAHLRFFDKMYLKYGRVRPPKNAAAPQPPPSEISEPGTSAQRHKNQRGHESKLVDS